MEHASHSRGRSTGRALITLTSLKLRRASRLVGGSEYNEGGLLITDSTIASN